MTMLTHYLTIFNSGIQIVYKKFKKISHKILTFGNRCTKLLAIKREEC